MSVRLDSELTRAISRSIERLLRFGRPSSEETDSFFDRVRAAIIRWERATHDQDQCHQDYILDCIHADRDLDLEHQRIPDEILDDVLSPWTRNFADTNQSIACIQHHPTRVLLYKIYWTIDKFYSSGRTDTMPVVSEAHMITRMTEDTYRFLQNLESSIVKWEQASEIQQEIITRLDDDHGFYHHTDYPDPEPSQLATASGNRILNWQNLVNLGSNTPRTSASQLRMPDFSLSQATQSYLDGTAQDTFHSNELSQHQSSLEDVSLIGEVELGLASPEGWLLRDLSRMSLLLRERINELLDALSLLGIEPPRKIQILWKRLGQELLPADYLDSSASGLECPICWELVPLGGVFAELHCKHRYHTECIARWLICETTCPMCRREV